MSDFPSDLRYTNDHEWARIDNNIARVGVSQFAVEQLGDVTMVELPETGDGVTKDEVFGTVESVKAVSDLLAPLSGTVVKINNSLEDTPEAVNDEPYGSGWMIEIELSDPGEVNSLMSAEDYSKFVAEQED